MKYIKLGNKFIGGGKPVFVVAEISANHAQDFKTAAAMIKKAKVCGADAVKFQTYTPDSFTINSANKYFRIKHPRWGGQTLYQLYKKASMPWSWFGRLKKIADDEGIVFFSTAFDKKSVDLLEEIGVPFHKVSSFELVDLPLIEYISKAGKPVILSTGISSYSEIREAVKAARKAGAKDIALLRCVSSYPANPDDMNLRTIAHMKKVFNCPVGLSDHTLGTGISIAAAAVGADLIEKHFTLSRRIKTPDSFFSIEPNELKMLVDNVRMVERSLGEITYGPTENEKKSLIFRRSLFVVKDISKGEVFTEENIRSIRPSSGLPPKFLYKIIGRRACRNIRRGTPLKWTFVDKG